MFKSATVKLTAIYITILLGICAFFSVNWYTLATHELNQALRRQSSMVELLPNVRGSNAVRDILEEREARLVEGKRNIARQLFGVNILLIVVGGLGAFYMAKRTLAPIEKAHKAQARFTADASHELRTPIAAMQTEIEVALRDPKFTKSEAIGLLKSNLEELDSLTRLSDGLLRLAREKANGHQPHNPINIQKLFEVVWSRTQKQAQMKRITLNFDKTSNIVHGQFDSLVELFVNLVDNAIKYSAEETTVNITAKMTKQGIKMSVKDQGIGIDTIDIPHIFESFYRADASRTGSKVQGHGLGLSMAQHIAKEHDTELKVTSVKGRGTEFSIVFPRIVK
jgi:signal transduction histidine kinase